MISKSFSCKIPSKHAFMSVLTKYKWFLKKKTHKNKPFHNRCLFSTIGFINTAINYKTSLDLFSSLKQTLSSLRRCHQFQIWQLQSKMDHMTKIQHFGVYIALHSIEPQIYWYYISLCIFVTGKKTYCQIRENCQNIHQLFVNWQSLKFKKSIFQMWNAYCIIQLPAHKSMFSTQFPSVTNLSHF